jgi:hypothetical protein
LDNPLSDLDSNDRMRLEVERVSGFHNLLAGARVGLERLHGAYGAKEALGNLVDVCVPVAKKIESEEIYQYHPVQAVVGRAVTRAAAALNAAGGTGVAGPTTAFLNGPPPPSSHPWAAAYWDHHHRRLEADPFHVLPKRSGGIPSELNQAPKAAMGGTEGIYRVTNNTTSP